MILLTGGSGSLGSEFIRQASGLLRIKAISRRSSGALSSDFLEIKSDLKELRTHSRFLTDLKGIVHLAAARSDAKNVDIYEDTRITGDLLDFWREGNFVFTSSQIVYREDPNSELTEESACSPFNWYAASKLISETLITTQYKVNQGSKDFNGNYVIFRVPLVLYPFPGKNQILDMLRLPLSAGINFCLPYAESEAGSYGSSWVGAGDLASSLINAVSYSDSGIYNIASGYISTVDFLEKMIRRTNSKSRILFGNNKAGIALPVSNIRLSAQKLSQRGFVPSDDIDDLIDRFLSACQKSSPPPNALL